MTQLNLSHRLLEMERAISGAISEGTVEQLLFEHAKLVGLLATFRATDANMSTEILAVKTDPRAGEALRNHLKGDVGFDLSVWFDDIEEMSIQPGDFVKLPTGLNIKVGDNAWGCIRPRSSAFFHKRLFVMEGTIDSGYIGPMFVIVFNPTNKPVTVKNGDRMAQLIPIPKFIRATVRFVDKLPETERGNRGFGSTDGEDREQPTQK